MMLQYYLKILNCFIVTYLVTIFNLLILLIHFPKAKVVIPGNVHIFLNVCLRSNLWHWNIIHFIIILYHKIILYVNAFSLSYFLVGQLSLKFTEYLMIFNICLCNIWVCIELIYLEICIYHFSLALLLIMEEDLVVCF